MTKKRSYWLRLDAIPVPGVLIRSGKFRHRDTRKEYTHTHTHAHICDDRGKAWNDASTIPKMPGLSGNPQKLEERQNRFSLRTTENDPALLTPSFLDVCLQNWETINLCYFKLLSLWHFVNSSLRKLMYTRHGA